MSWSDKHEPAPPTPPTLLTVGFWRDATERAIRTVAQALVLYAGGGTLDAWNTDWATAAGVAAGAGLLAYLTAVAAAPFGQPGTASLLHTGGADG